jgi:hypothetical protein
MISRQLQQSRNRKTTARTEAMNTWDISLSIAIVPSKTAISSDRSFNHRHSFFNPLEWKMYIANEVRNFRWIARRTIVGSKRWNSVSRCFLKISLARKAIEDCSTCSSLEEKEFQRFIRRFISYRSYLPRYRECGDSWRTARVSLYFINT